MVSRWRTPVMRSTTSLSDSRCWMFTVEMTSMPAASSSSTSCHRFSLRLPGTLVWASSSTRATSGRRARTAVEVHLLELGALDGSAGAGGRPRGRRSARRSSPGRGSRRRPTTTSVPRSRRRRPSLSMAKVLPDAGRGAEVDAQGAPASPQVRPSRSTLRPGRCLRRPSSRARLSRRTFTPGSPRKPRARPSVWSSMRARTVSRSRPRSSATRVACSAALATEMWGSSARAG